MPQTPPVLMYSRDVSSVEKLSYITYNRILMQIEMVWLELRNKLLHYIHNVLFPLFFQKKIDNLYVAATHLLLMYSRDVPSVVKELPCFTYNKILMKIKRVWLEWRNQLWHYYHHVLFHLSLRKRFIIYTVPHHALC